MTDCKEAAALPAWPWKTKEGHHGGLRVRVNGGRVVLELAAETRVGEVVDSGHSAMAPIYAAGRAAVHNPYGDLLGVAVRQCDAFQAYVRLARELAPAREQLAAVTSRLAALQATRARVLGGPEKGLVGRIHDADAQVSDAESEKGDLENTIKLLAPKEGERRSTALEALRVLAARVQAGIGNQIRAELEAALNGLFERESETLTKILYLNHAVRELGAGMLERTSQDIFEATAVGEIKAAKTVGRKAG